MERFPLGLELDEFPWPGFCAIERFVNGDLPLAVDLGRVLAMVFVDACNSLTQQKLESRPNDKQPGCDRGLSPRLRQRQNDVAPD